MINTMIKFYLFVLFCCGLTVLNAQTSINSAGGEATGSGGTVSYSVGQIFTSTESNESGSVAQGVQQPFEISVVTSLKEAKGINLVVSAYPNPTSDYLLLVIESEIENSNIAKLYDINGKIVMSEKIYNKETKIDMQSVTKGTYLLKLIRENKELVTFKIIKN